MSLLFITHDLGIVRRIADRVCVMKDGEIVEQGPPEIFADPRIPTRRKLLAPKPTGRPIRCRGREGDHQDRRPARLVPDPARACCAGRWAM
jgi:ABC-type microcin C transport system duplicated ATPase subunit YejF